MKRILHFISFLFLWSLILSSYTAFSTPLFQNCMESLSKMGKKRKATFRHFFVQDRVKQLTSTYMSSTIQEASEYDRAIAKLAQLEKRLQNTLDSSEREALEIQVRGAENKVDELLQRNRNNVKNRMREIHAFRQEIQAEVQ